MTGRFAPVFQRMIDAPVEHLNLLRADAAGYAQDALKEEGASLTPNALLPAHEALGFILFDKSLVRIELTGATWLPEVQSFGDLEASIVRTSPDRRLLLLNMSGDRPVHAFWAPISETTSWNLPDRVRKAATSGTERLVLLAVGSLAGGPLEAAVRSFALTDLEQRVVIEMVRHGNGRRVAANLNLAYATVREILAAASRKCRQPNTAALIRMIVAASYGVFPGDLNEYQVISDMLQLSQRQSRIAVMLAAGNSRVEVAKAIGISMAVLKKEVEYIYGTLGLVSVSELARLLVEAQALNAFARAIDGAPGFLETGIEPSRFLIRPNGRELVGWSDHGPSSGKPILVVHSNWSCRPIPRPLVAALQERGYRPIAIDRPGFGSTSPGGLSNEEPFAQAIADLCQLMEQLKIRKLPIVARCGAQFVHAFKQAHPEKVGKVVLVSPTPPTTPEGLRRGVVGTVKEAFFGNPHLIELLFRVICSQVTLARVESLTRAIVKGSKTDELICDDPAFIRDRFRSIRPFATGNFSGAIHEERLISTIKHELTSLDAPDWIVVQGDSDTHNSVDEVDSYWRRVLPNSRFLVLRDGGRFITHSHAKLVADLL